MISASRTTSAWLSVGPPDSFISMVSLGFSEKAGVHAGANSRKPIRMPPATPIEAVTHRLATLGNRRFSQELEGRRGQGAWLRVDRRRRHLGSPREGRHVVPPGQVDPHRPVLRVDVVVAGERRPKARRLDPHDRVDRRVEAGWAAEDVNGDRIGLDCIAAALNQFFRDKAQEFPVTVGAVKFRIGEYSLQLLFGLGIGNVAPFDCVGATAICGIHDRLLALSFPKPK